MQGGALRLTVWNVPVVCLDDKESACNAGDSGSIPGSGRSLEEEMVTYSSILTWEIPRTEEPDGL